MADHASIDHTGLTGVGGSSSAHGVRAIRSGSNFSIGNNTYTVVEFNAEDFDTDTMHDNSSSPGRITIPSISGVTTGLWHFTASGYITGGTVAHFKFRQGGTTDKAFGVNNDAAVGSFHLSTDLVLSATNYIELLVKCPTGAASAVFDSGISPIFSAVFIGKVT